MVTIFLDRPSGERLTLDVPAGISVMEAAVSNGVDEILADCGGALSCATCHVYVEGEWATRIPAPVGDEEAMLEFVAEPEPTSRLCCQINLAPELDGLVVRLPARQQ